MPKRSIPACALGPIVFSHFFAFLLQNLLRYTLACPLDQVVVEVAFGQVDPGSERFLVLPLQQLPLKLNLHVVVGFDCNEEAVSFNGAKPGDGLRSCLS